MADVYEQNLPSKANLTTNDYIRVVGSDNNSYKQLVSDVAKKIIENYTGSSLAGSSQSVKSALDTLNSNKVSLVVSQIISALVGCGTSNRAFEITANQNDGDQYRVVVTSKALGESKNSAAATLDVAGNSLEGATIVFKNSGTEYTGKAIVPEVSKVTLGDTVINSHIRILRSCRCNCYN